MKSSRFRPGWVTVIGQWVSGVCLLGLLSGCAAPWDRDLLAKQGMQLNTHPNIMAAHEHIYFSKEGSSGGRTFVGGGCGCN
jgi:hypothetical protein